MTERFAAIKDRLLDRKSVATALATLAFGGFAAGCGLGSPTYKAIRVPTNAMMLGKDGHDDLNFVVYPKDVQDSYCGYVHLPNIGQDDDYTIPKTVHPYQRGLEEVTCVNVDADSGSSPPIKRFETHSGPPVVQYLQIAR